MSLSYLHVVMSEILGLELQNQKFMGIIFFLKILFTHF